MKNVYIILVITLMTVFTACGGGGGDGDSPSSNEIFTESVETGPNSEDIPSASVSGDIAEVSCDDNWVTEDGYLFLMCIDKNGDDGASIYLACSLGQMLVQETGDDVYAYDSNCLKFHCDSAGNGTYTLCEDDEE